MRNSSRARSRRGRWPASAPTSPACWSPSTRWRWPENGLRPRSAPAAIGRNALIRNPHAFRKLTGLPEHVDRDAAARIPVAADPQVFRLDRAGDALADHHGAVLME